METKMQIVKERSGREYRKEGMRMCIQEVAERKPKACSSFLWGIRGSHRSCIHCFDKIPTFCFVAGAKFDTLSGF